MHTVALAGNPNTGKSTLFNVLTGLRQHTGNWPGKTVLRAEGTMKTDQHQYQMIDLPGTYSLYSNSADEEVARDHIILEKPDITLVVLDATSLERNLNLALQVLEMTSNVIICINLIDEADKKGIKVNKEQLSESLGVPVILLSAREKVGLIELMKTMDRMVEGKIESKPYQVQYNPELEEKIAKLEPEIINLFGNDLPSRWVALRILDGDQTFLEALKNHGNHSEIRKKPQNIMQGGCCHGA